MVGCRPSRPRRRRRFAGAIPLAWSYGETPLSAEQLNQVAGVVADEHVGALPFTRRARTECDLDAARLESGHGAVEIVRSGMKEHVTLPIDRRPMPLASVAPAPR